MRIRWGSRELLSQNSLLIPLKENGTKFGTIRRNIGRQKEHRKKNSKLIDIRLGTYYNFYPSV